MLPNSLIVLLSVLGLCNADDVGAYSSDPYLQYRPPFVRSLPIQILLTGIVLALVTVLFIHLLFTAQYHWPLAPVNYTLQLSAVITLLISLIATLHVVLSAALVESQRWPYMLSYVAVNVPPLDVENTTLNNWSTAERATWLTMNAATSGLVQITHIHFLTLLYPSSPEGRLILFLLGPLALIAAVMQLIPIQGIASQTTAITIATVLRNICNATLSLLFTIGLFIWGFLINRRQAWRTDGGTAVFGATALFLALSSTALNFVYIDREEDYVWLPGLMWAIVLWQSFLGWWWWVGAGSGTNLLGETLGMEERLKRQEKNELRRREWKSTSRIRAKSVFKGVKGAFGSRPRPSGDEDHDATTTAVPSSYSSGTTERPRRRHRSPSKEPDEQSDQEACDADSDTLQTTASTTQRSVWPNFVLSWYASLSHAHREAARAQEVERAERMRGLGSQHPIRKGGWGLGSFGRRAAQGDRFSLTKAKTKPKERKANEDEGQEEVEMSPTHSSPPLRRTQSDTTLCSPSTPELIATPIPSYPLPLAVAHTEPPTPGRRQQRSIWWWGPLRRWRLQDTTIY